jgi:cleavage and polyadenylation specificity factor subunit 3
MNAVDLLPALDTGIIHLEWTASPINDMVADSVVALLLGVETSPASVKCK